MEIWILADAKEAVRSDSAFSDFSANFIDKAWELRWGLKLTYVVLFLDASLAIFAKRDLFSFSLTVKEAWEHAGAILVGVAFFSLLVSLVIPMLAQFFRVLGRLFPWYKLDDHRDDEAGRGYVPCYKLKEFAIRENNEFAWARYQEQAQLYDRLEAHKLQVGSLTFGLAVLLVIDTCIGVTQGVATLGLLLWEYTGLSGLGLMAIFLVGVLRTAWWGPWQRELVYYPPLYEKLRDQARDHFH